MVSVTHATQASGTDAGNGEIGKAEWNAAHALSQATATILGRVTAGTGTTEELNASQVRTLINVEDGADVTDATNVDAAGAVMNADTSTAGMSFVDGGSVATNSATKVPTQAAVKTYVDSSDAAYYSAATSRANHTGTQLASTISDFSTAADLRISAAILDEDDMASNSATKVPTQQSVKAYVDASSGSSFVAGSPVTASGANVTFTNIDCDDIVFKIDGVSHNNGTNSSLRLYYSTDNGSSWSSSLVVLSATFAASLFLSGTVAIFGAREGTGMIVAGQGSTSITFPNIITLGISPTHAISAGAQINAIKFEWNTGASFDAGTITASTRG